MEMSGWQMKRKGIFFSIVSVMLVILFGSITYMMQETRGTENEIEVTRTRIKVLNSLMEDLEDTYFEDMVYVSAKNSIMGLSRYYMGDVSRIDYPLSEALKYTIDDGILKLRPSGTVDLTIDPFAFIKEDYTFASLTERLVTKYRDMGMDITHLNITVIDVTQDDPWRLTVEADIDYDVKDMSGIAFWRGKSTKNVDISLYGIHLYDQEGGWGGGRRNTGPVTSFWIVDQGSTWTEPTSFYKLSIRSPNLLLHQQDGLGICSPTFDGGCQND
jgi:hypothetical protein